MLRTLACCLTLLVTPTSSPAPALQARLQAQNIHWIWPHQRIRIVPQAPVAVMLERIELRGHRASRHPRMQALHTPTGSNVTPVVHVISFQSAPDGLSGHARRTILDALVKHASTSTSGWVQLDFEASLRQRTAYVELVAMARQNLPAHLKLSVTALASWCQQGPWLDNLAADEIVPMLYQLGAQAQAVRSQWLDAESLHPRCRSQAIGFSIQEPPNQSLQTRYARRYWFDPRRNPSDSSRL